MTQLLTPANLKSPSSDSGRRPIRVGHVSLGLSTGGLERLLVDFARFHDRSEFEMVFVALNEAGRPADDIVKSGCEVIALQSERAGRLERLQLLAQVLKDLRVDVVHTHNAFPHWYATAAARWARVPVVINTRHGQRFGQSWKARLQYWLASLMVNRVVAVSDDAARLCCQDDHLPASKVTRIWNGIDSDKFQYRGPVRRPVAISVARLSKEKDFPTLLRAVGIVRDEIPEFKLKIVGDGAERLALEKLAAEMRLGGTVEFLGEQSRVPELLAEAGFFVSSSLTEGISLTLLEAMAVGLPVLATAVGGNPEIVVPGETGLLVPAADPRALAKGIVQLCRDSDRWDEYGASGRLRVEKHFDIRRMVRDYENLYRDLLGTRTPALTASE